MKDRKNISLSQLSFSVSPRLSFHSFILHYISIIIFFNRHHENIRKVADIMFFFIHYHVFEKQKYILRHRIIGVTCIFFIISDIWKKIGEGEKVQ